MTMLGSVLLCLISSASLIQVVINCKKQKFRLTKLRNNISNVLYLGILASSFILQEDVKLRYPDSSSSWLREKFKEQKKTHIAVVPGILHGEKAQITSDSFKNQAKCFKDSHSKLMGLPPLDQGSKCIYRRYLSLAKSFLQEKTKHSDCVEVKVFTYCLRELI